MVICFVTSNIFPLTIKPLNQYKISVNHFSLQPFIRFCTKESQFQISLFSTFDIDYGVGGGKYQHGGTTSHSTKRTDFVAVVTKTKIRGTVLSYMTNLM
jgi:hypothetical protein